MNLKQKMTYEEMAMHMKENSFMIPSRVTVGKYARELGFTVYKPMVKGKIYHFYVNRNIPK